MFNIGIIYGNNVLLYYYCCFILTIMEENELNEGETG
jgi:hypothetical protein